MKKHRHIRLLVAVTILSLVFTLIPITASAAPDSVDSIRVQSVDQILLSEVRLVEPSPSGSGNLPVTVSENGTVLTVDDTKDWDDEAINNPLLLYFDVNVEKFVTDNMDPGRYYYSRANAASGLRLINFAVHQPYDTDYNYSIYKFTLYEYDSGAKIDSTATEFTLRVKKWERQYQPKNVPTDWLELRHLEGSKATVEIQPSQFTPVPGQTQLYEYVIAEDVAFPYTTNIYCGYHYQVTGYLDGVLFDRGPQSLTFTAGKNYYDLRFVPPAGGLWDTKHETYVPATWRLRIVPVSTYLLTVNGGSGSGNHAAGTSVTLIAGTAPSGKIFDKWTGGNGGSFANVNSASTTFTMPSNAATVTATYKNPPAGTILVTGITVSGGASISAKGGTVQLTANVTPSNANNKNVTWTSSNATIATVNTSGKVTAKTNGTVTIRATAQDGSVVYGEKTITITGQSSGNGDGDKVGSGETPLTETPVAHDKIPAAQIPTAPGNKTKLPATVTFPDGTSADVTWTSSNSSIARIDANGNIVGASEGKVTLTARTKGGKTYSITVTIAKNVSKIRTPLTKLYLKKGKAMTPPVCADSVDATTKKADTAAKLEWASSNAKVAAVNQATGKITPKKPGTVTITATALNGKKLTIKVYVVEKAKELSKLSLIKAPKKMAKGKTAQLKVKVTSAKATNLLVKFKSSKSSVVKVDKAGKLTALKKGKAKITVSIGKKKYTKIITVK